MIVDNDGYSSNNEMNQGAGNQLYPNEPQRETGQIKGMFLVGLLTGVVVSALAASCIFIGIKFADVIQQRRVKPASTEHTAAENVVSDDTMAKLEAIEEVIEKYYYQEEDINTDGMIEGMYAGVVASL